MNSAPDRKWRIALVAGTGLALLVASWLVGWSWFRTDPRVVEIRALQAELGRKLADTGGPTTLVEAAQTASEVAHVRRRVLALPKDLQGEAEAHGQKLFLEAIRGRVTRYFALPAEARRAELDRHIRQDEMLRQAFLVTEAVGSVFGSLSGGGSADGTGTGSATAGSKNSPPASAAGATDPTDWLRVMIDSTSPSERASFIEYRRGKDQRRVELGLPPM